MILELGRVFNFYWKWNRQIHEFLDKGIIGMLIKDIMCAYTSECVLVCCVLICTYSSIIYLQKHEKTHWRNLILMVCNIKHSLYSSQNNNVLNVGKELQMEMKLHFIVMSTTTQLLYYEAKCLFSFAEQCVTVVAGFILKLDSAFVTLWNL